MKKIKNGFTLIELLVVVLIIGILAAVALPQYQKAVLKARYTQIQVMARALYEDLQAYYLANSAWPTQLEDISLSVTGEIQGNAVLSGDYKCGYFPATGNTIHCYYNNSIGIRYILNDHTYQRSCIAHESQESEKNFCVSMGGENPTFNGTGLLYYKLP